MNDRRTKIEQALEKIDRRKRALDFQWIAFHLAKNKWSDLEATEWYSDGGEDGLTIPSTGSDGIKRSLACSITGTFKKVNDDSERIKGRGEKIDILIFSTPKEISNLQVSDWQEKIRKKYNHDLLVLPKSFIVSNLERDENTWLCKDYLELDFTNETDIKKLKKRVWIAAKKDLENWKAFYEYDEQYQIELLLKLEIEDKKYDFFNISGILEFITRNRQVILAGSPGAGKTITLLQIATSFIHNQKHQIPIFISLNEWSINSQDLFSFIAANNAFLEENITASDLALLNKAGSITLFLNGWNEISYDNIQKLNQLLKNVIRNSPATSFIIATREKEIAPPFKNPKFILIDSLTSTQRREIINKNNLADTETLFNLIENEPDLDKITRTPLFLFSIIEISKKTHVIPTSRYEILKEFIINAEKEHKIELETSSLEGFHIHFLSWLAAEYAKLGKTGSSEKEAQIIIGECSDFLIKNRIIGNIPNAKKALNTLIDHHLLIRSRDQNLIRFFHHQFQEWYSANYLYEEILSICKNNRIQDIFNFQKEIINNPYWEESLKFVCERIALDCEDLVELGSNLIQWIMKVDLILASKLASIIGNPVWLIIKNELSMILRKCYNFPNDQYKKFALTAMFATTSDEFSDIILPLIENEDDQIRLQTYYLWEPFPLTTLGLDWKEKISSWPQEQLIELINQIGWNAGFSHLNLVIEFAEQDDNLSVRVAAMQMLALNGIVETLNNILINFDWSIDIYSEVLNWLNKSSLLMLAPSLKAAIPKIKNPKTRLRILLKLTETKDLEAIEFLKKDIEKNSFESKTVINQCLALLIDTSQNWIQNWLVNKLLDGQLWEELYDMKIGYKFSIDNLNVFFKNLESNSLKKLSKQVFNIELEMKIFRKRLIVFSKINTDYTAILLLKEYLNLNIELKKNPKDKNKQERERTIYSEIKSLSFCSKVNAVLNFSSLIPNYQNIISILNFLSSETEYYDNSMEVLSMKARKQLKELIFGWGKLNLNSEFDHGQLKAYLAEILGLIGNSKDLNIIEQWIIDDKQRTNNEYTEWKNRYEDWQKNRQYGKSPPGIFVKHVRARHYVRAISQIKSKESVKLLLTLLYDPEYIGQAAHALFNITNPIQENRANNFLLKLDYENILKKRNRNNEKLNHQKKQIYKISAEIDKAINNIIDQKVNAGTPKFSLYEISLAATVLGQIGDEGILSTILKLAKFEECYYEIPRALENLINNGVILPGAIIFKSIEPIITKFKNDFLNGDQNISYMIYRCINILLFTDNPDFGLKILKELPSRCKSDFQIRESIQAIGNYGNKKVIDFLIELKNHPEILKFSFREWLNALANYSDPRIRKILMNYLNRFINDKKIEENQDSSSEYMLEYAICKLIKTDNKFWTDIEAQCKNSILDKERIFLSSILEKLDTDKSVFAACHLIRDDSELPIPNWIFRIIENEVTKRISSKHTNAYNIESKASHKLRDYLFNLVINDSERKKSALILLVYIELIRIENGKPQDEFRHPNIETMIKFDKPWPLLMN